MHRYIIMCSPISLIQVQTELPGLLPAPPASRRIIHENDTPQHKTNATHNNAYASPTPSPVCQILPFLIYLLRVFPQRFIMWQVQFSMWAVSCANHVMTSHALPQAKPALFALSHSLSLSLALSYTRTDAHTLTQMLLLMLVTNQSPPEGVVRWLHKKSGGPKCHTRGNTQWRCIVPYICKKCFGFHVVPL